MKEGREGWMKEKEGRRKREIDREQRDREPTGDLDSGGSDFF